MRRWWSRSATVLWVTLVSSVGSARTREVGPIDVVLTNRNPDFTEGLAFSRHGDMYVGYALTGEILRVSPDGALSSLASLDPTDTSIMTGLAVDRDDNVYAALWAFADESINGVWKVTPAGEATLFGLIPFGTIPNFIVFDGDDNLLVTDSSGAVWFVPRGGGDAQLWLADELLVAPPSGFFGANGAVRDGDELFVVNSDAGRIVRIPIQGDGSAGDPTLFLEHRKLVGGDGLAMDVHRNLYVPNVYTGRLLRVSPSGDLETLVVFPESLMFPTNIEFGGGRDVLTAYLTIDGAADVVKLDLGVPGR